MLADRKPRRAFELLVRSPLTSSRVASIQRHAQGPKRERVCFDSVLLHRDFQNVAFDTRRVRELVKKEAFNNR